MSQAFSREKQSDQTLPHSNFKVFLGLHWGHHSDGRILIQRHKSFYHSIKAPSPKSEQERISEKYSNYGQQKRKYEVMFKGMMEHSRLLVLLKHFILFSKNTPEDIKILAGYHQYYAVQKAITSTQTTMEALGSSRD